MTLPAPGPTLAPKALAAPAPAAVSSGTAGTSGLQPEPEEAAAPPPVAGPSEIIGPFVVVSVGNRLGTLEAQKAAKIAPVQQNVLMLRIKIGSKEEELYEKLLAAIRRFGQSSYSIELHGK